MGAAEGGGGTIDCFGYLFCAYIAHVKASRKGQFFSLGGIVPPGLQVELALVHMFICSPNSTLRNVPSPTCSSLSSNYAKFAPCSASDHPISYFLIFT